VQSTRLTICNTLRADVRGNVVPAASDVTDLVPTYIGLVESSTSTLELVETPPTPVTRRGRRIMGLLCPRVWPPRRRSAAV
jgi:hypothetical protein